MKKLIVTILLLFSILFIQGCYYFEEQQLSINQIQPLVVTIGDQIELTNIKFEDNGILEENYKGVFANKVGEIIVSSDEGEYFIIVKEEIVLDVVAQQLLSIGDKVLIETLILPNTKNQDVVFECSDTDIISVSSNGEVSAISAGVARVIVSSKEYNINKEVTFVVLDNDEEYYEAIVNTIIQSSTIYLDDSYTNIIKGILNYNTMSLVGVSTYNYRNTFIVEKDFGGGIIYKMNIIYNDGSIEENVVSLTEESNIKEFEYYVITNRHLLTRKNTVKIYIGEDYDEIDAEIVEYDDKIDLAVLKFKSKYYFPPAKLGDSNNIEKGEFIISIGHGTGKTYYRSSTFGVISSVKRYVTTDTDGDNVNDWDSEYIQHDASINECDSGGAIMNLKGEIIGINSTKISSTTYNNMSFAIPINLVMEIVSQLEQGIRPKRATLGVQILDVTGYWENTDYYNYYYPYVKIPDNIRYGFYVTVVDKGGVAEKAKVQVGDIIVGFNNVELKYSYQIRAELGKFLLGSGQIAEMKVFRNGEVVTLSVEF